MQGQLNYKIAILFKLLSLKNNWKSKILKKKKLEKSDNKSSFVQVKILVEKNVKT